MKIDSVDLDDPRVQLIEDGLDDHNDQFIRPLEVERYAFIASDEDHEFLGGASGKVFAGWCELSLLYSNKKVSGTGSELVSKVESFAREQKLQGIIVNTFGFQAPDFYKKLGFEIFGTVPDYVDGYDRYYLIKRF